MSIGNSAPRQYTSISVVRDLMYRSPYASRRKPRELPNIDYRELISSKIKTSAENLMKGMEKVIDCRDWKALNELVDNWSTYTDERMQSHHWYKLLNLLSQTPLFLRFFEKFKKAGNEPGVSVYTSMMLWLIWQQRFENLTECFQTIKEPTSSAYRTYLNGLLRADDSSLIIKAKETMISMMIEGRGKIDSNSLAFLMKKLLEQEDFESCKNLFTQTLDSGAQIEEPVLQTMLRTVESEEDFNALLDQAKSIKVRNPETFSGIFSSRLAKDLLNPDLLYNLCRKFGTAPNKSFFRQVLDHYDLSLAKLVQFLSQPWALTEMNVITSILYDSKKFQIYRNSSVEASEVLVSALLRQAPTADDLVACSRLAVKMLKTEHRFSFDLGYRLLERLIFYGKHGESADLVLSLAKHAESLKICSAPNLLLKSFYDSGKVSEGQRVVRNLININDSRLEPSISYGANLFFASKVESELPQLFDLPQLVTSVNTLLKKGRVDQAKTLLDEHDIDEDFCGSAEYIQLLLCKLQVCAMSSKSRREYQDCLVKLASILKEPTLSSLCSFGIEISRNKSGTFETVVISTVTPLITNIANIIFQNACSHQGLTAALGVKKILFEDQSPIRMSKHSFKSYIHLLKIHCQDVSELASAVDLLEEMDKMGMESDMSVYHRLIEYAMVLEDFGQVNQILAAIIKKGGAISRKIIDSLFTWLQSHGDLRACTDLFEMLNRQSILPSRTAFDTLVIKSVDTDKLKEAKQWIVDSTDSRYFGRSRCSDQAVSHYFDLYYRSHSLEECQAEIIDLMGIGYTVSADFYSAFFNEAMGKKDAGMARTYLNRLLHQNRPPPCRQFLELAAMLMNEGRLDAAYKVHASVLSVKPLGVESAPATFTEYIDETVEGILQRDPEWLGRLHAPQSGQPSHGCRPILDVAIRKGLRLPDEWCQRVLANLVARGMVDDADAFAMYMTTKQIPFGRMMALDVCGQWRSFRLETQRLNFKL